MTNNRDAKAKFREALQKKRSVSSPSNQPKGGKSKVRGGQSIGGTPKIFRRKSGSN